MSEKARDNHGRWRSKTIAFRISPEENEMLEDFTRLSGLSKQDYIIHRVLNREVTIIPNHWYGEGTLMNFEGIQVLAPLCWHEWLTQMYGEYMQLPPVEKRVAHHYVAAFDLTKPYTERK